MDSGQSKLTRLLDCRCALLVCAVLVCVFAGCNRRTYRDWADRDAYRLIQSHKNDARWQIPDRAVEPDPRSRLADVQDPDCGPPTLDDPSAECYMRYPYHSKKRVDYWDKKGNPVAIDSQHWLDHLPYDDDGTVLLDKQLTLDLALLNSREFQTRVERLYSTALVLSSNRFEYELNWFGGSSTLFRATDDGVEADRDLNVANQFGFTRNLATGGQLAVNLLNSFAWQFNGNGNSNLSAGNVVFGLTQPLLRGAFRYVRTESLTQAERNLLYEIRDFAHFRREFYLDIVSQYLELVNQAQSVRNNEENLENLRRNLDEFEVLFELGQVSTIEVDQVFQQFQTGRIDVIESQQRLQNSLDRFKFQMGLPARVPIRFDQAILNPFQLNSSALEKLQTDAQELEQSMMKYLPMDGPAPVEFLNDVEKKLNDYADQLELLEPDVKAELETWKEQLDSSKPGEDASQSEIDEYDLQSDLAAQVQVDLQELEELIINARNARNALPPEVEEDKKEDDPLIIRWKQLQRRIADRGGLTDRISILFVRQTQIRLFLIQIKPLEIEEATAVELALENRFELMNSRAAVVDAYRAVEIAADRLQSDLDVSTSADLRTDPTRDNAFRIDGDENVYTVGLEFDGPLNRLNERNVYRVAQIAYQQQRREYMAVEDSIVNSVRFNIRELRANLLNFQIFRQQLLTAARQVEEAQINLRESSTGNSSQTRDLLQALERLRASKNSLISRWIAYETSRIALYVDLELLMLDSNGVWINDRGNFDEYIKGGRPGLVDDIDLNEGAAAPPSAEPANEPAAPAGQPSPQLAPPGENQTSRLEDSGRRSGDIDRRSLGNLLGTR